MGTVAHACKASPAGGSAAGKNDFLFYRLRRFVSVQGGKMAARLGLIIVGLIVLQLGLVTFYVGLGTFF